MIDIQKIRAAPGELDIWQWLDVLNELEAARDEIVRLKKSQEPVVLEHKTTCSYCGAPTGSVGCQRSHP